MHYKIILSILLYSFLSNGELEISGHHRGARPGASIRYIYGGRIRYNFLEATVENIKYEKRTVGYIAPIWRLSTKGIFQPHAFLGFGRYGYFSLVPGLGFHLQFGSIAIRMDIYYYFNLKSSTDVRNQTYGLSWTF